MPKFDGGAARCRRFLVDYFPCESLYIGSLTRLEHTENIASLPVSWANLAAASRRGSFSLAFDP
jgi:hypothetical protein